jgi:hypothetical protein
MTLIVIQTGTGVSTGGGEPMLITIGSRQAMELGCHGGGGSGTGSIGDIGTGGQPIFHTKNVVAAAYLGVEINGFNEIHRATSPYPTIDAPFEGNAHNFP